AIIKRTKKPVVAWINCKNTAEYILKIFEAVSGGAKELQDKPLIKGLLTPVSPLQFNKEGSDILMLFADRGLPLGVGSMVMAMVSGPATLAGTVALQNAEVLAGITISQLLRPGLPVLYAGIPHISDPRNVNICFGSPEQGIMAVMITALTKKYALPTAINVGLTDSNVPDGQAGVEKAATLLLGMLAGADAYGGMGISGADQGFNIAQLVIDDEIIAYLKRIIKGAEVSDETLAYNVIKEVGIGGSFISMDHTLQHFRKELWFPTIFERLGWEVWEQSGSMDLLERAGEKAEKIILQQKEEEINKDLVEEIDTIYATAEKCLVLKR
ncbi:trimethylamine---corrinoid protein Co-methyltransferase, partial [Candidatus Hakubella thermalkaliphila]